MSFLFYSNGGSTVRAFLNLEKLPDCSPVTWLHHSHPNSKPRATEEAVWGSSNFWNTYTLLFPWVLGQPAWVVREDINDSLYFTDLAAQPRHRGNSDQGAKLQSRRSPLVPAKRKRQSDLDFFTY